jgi:hypothetical protein
MAVSDKERGPRRSCNSPGLGPQKGWHATCGHQELYRNGTHPSTREEPLHACLEGVVYVGHLVEEDGEEAEVVEAVPCRRCGPVAADVGISDPTKRNA